MRRSVTNVIIDSLLLFVVTEYEIASGMPTAQDCEKHCIGMLRTIDDLDQHLDEPAVAKFVDLIPGTSLIDDEAQGLLNALRDEKIPRSVQSSEYKFIVLFNAHTQRILIWHYVCIFDVDNSSLPPANEVAGG